MLSRTQLRPFAGARRDRYLRPAARADPRATRVVMAARRATTIESLARMGAATLVAARTRCPEARAAIDSTPTRQRTTIVAVTRPTATGTSINSTGIAPRLPSRQSLRDAGEAYCTTDP